MVQTLVDEAPITHNERLQPSFGVQTPKRLMARSVGRARRAQTGDQAQKCGSIRIIEHALLGPNSINDFLSARKTSRLVRHARSGELKAPPTECDFGG